MLATGCVFPYLYLFSAMFYEYFAKHDLPISRSEVAALYATSGVLVVVGACLLARSWGTSALLAIAGIVYMVLLAIPFLFWVVMMFGVRAT